MCPPLAWPKRIWVQIASVSVCLPLRQAAWSDLVFLTLCFFAGNRLLLDQIRPHYPIPSPVSFVISLSPSRTESEDRIGLAWHLEFALFSCLSMFAF